MPGKNSIVETLKNAFQLYRSTFKICFIIAMLLSVITEGFKVYAQSLGLGKVVAAYINTGKIDESALSNHGLLMFLAVATIVLTLLVYGLLICIGAIKAQSAQNEGFFAKDMQAALLMLRRRFWSFVGAFILSIILWVFGSFLSLIGIWIVISITLVFFPVVLIDNLNPFAGFKENLRLMRPHIWYVLQLGFIVVLLLFLKSGLYLLFTSITGVDQLGFGIEHVLMIFIEALFLPYVMMLSVAAFYELNKRDDLPTYEQ